MKKILALLLIVSLLACSLTASFAEEAQLPAGSVPEAGFSGMNDPNLLRYTEDAIYENLVATLDSDEYFVENVSAVYISQEYIDELAYNSQANIYFGYTLQELAEQFQGKKYIFTLGDDGSTIVTEFEEYDDTYDRALKNVAIGTGVILVCVTVSLVSAGLGAPAVSMIFSVAAKDGLRMALSCATLGGLSAGVVTGAQTGNMEEALKSALLAASEGYQAGAITGDTETLLKAAALAASESYKWSGIAGVINSGVSAATTLMGEGRSNLSVRETAAIQRESKYPLDVIKEFDSMDEYEVCLDAGLIARMVGGRTALVPDSIDLGYTSELPDGREVSNLTRMLEGYAPLDSTTDLAYHLYPIGQSANGTLAVLTEAQYQGNAAILSMVEKASESNQSVSVAVQQDFWMSFGQILANGQED